jgi:hypothetical protein
VADYNSAKFIVNQNMHQYFYAFARGHIATAIVTALAAIMRPQPSFKTTLKNFIFLMMLHNFHIRISFFSTTNFVYIHNVVSGGRVSKGI